MDKKHKQRRHKNPTKDELAEVDNSMTPGASFDTERGRAAQGMRPDLGGPSDADSAVPPRVEDAEHPPAEQTDR